MHREIVYLELREFWDITVVISKLKLGKFQAKKWLPSEGFSCLSYFSLLTDIVFLLMFCYLSLMEGKRDMKIHYRCMKEEVIHYRCVQEKERHDDTLYVCARGGDAL